MKAVSNNFKNAIKTLGRQLEVKITYTLNGSNIELSGDAINNYTTL